MEIIKKTFNFIFDLLRVIALEILGLMSVLAFHDMGILNSNWATLLAFVITLVIFFTYVWQVQKGSK